MEATFVPAERYVWLEVFATSPTMLTGAFMPQRFEPAARAVRTEDLEAAVEEARTAAREVFVYEVCAPCARCVCAVHDLSAHLPCTLLPCTHLPCT